VKKATTWRVLVAGLLTVTVLVLLVWQVHPGPLVDAAMGARVDLLALALFASLFFHTIQAAELLRQSLAGFSVRIGYRDALVATSGNIAIKATLPVGAGEIVRVAYLGRACAVPVPAATAAILFVLWVKMACLVLTSFVASFALSTPSFTVAMGICLAAVLLVPACLTLMGDPLRRRLAGGGGTWSRIATALASLERARGDLRPGRLLLASLHALASVAGEFMVFFIVLEASVGALPPGIVLARLPIVIVGAKLPLTLLGLGVRETGIVLLLSDVAQPGSLAASAMLFSLVQHVIPAVLATAVTWGYVSRILGGGRDGPGSG